MEHLVTSPSPSATQAAPLAAETESPARAAPELSADAKRLIELYLEKRDSCHPWYKPGDVMMEALLALANPYGICENHEINWAHDVLYELAGCLVMQHKDTLQQQA